jgi:hypothetical protein
LRKSGIHQAFGEFIVHTPIVDRKFLLQCCLGELPKQTLASRL